MHCLQLIMKRLGSPWEPNPKFIYERLNKEREEKRNSEQFTLRTSVEEAEAKENVMV